MKTGRPPQSARFRPFVSRRFPHNRRGTPDPPHGPASHPICFRQYEVPQRAISSAGERFPDTEEVTGSIPVSRTTSPPPDSWKFVPRAISSGGERFVHTEEVTGSIPVSPTRFAGEPCSRKARTGLFSSCPVGAQPPHPGRGHAPGPPRCGPVGWALRLDPVGTFTAVPSSYGSAVSLQQAALDCVGRDRVHDLRQLFGGWVRRGLAACQQEVGGADQRQCEGIHVRVRCYAALFALG